MIWDIDSAHSHLLFAIRVMGVSTTKGSFKTLHSRLHVDEQHPANSWVAAEAEAASIDTRNRLRDAHLRSAAFFDVKRYPTLVFQSTQVEPLSDQDYQVTGNLTLHGVTQSITFHVVLPGQGAKADGRAHLSARATINRNDFGVGRGVGVRFAASPLVVIELELEVVRQAVDAPEAAASAQ